MIDFIEQTAQQVHVVCTEQPRYRVAWLIGPPRRGKSILVRQMCERRGWAYLDYTLTPGYFDVLTATIAAFQPADLATAIRQWCTACSAPVLVVDEIDAVLATWDRSQRQIWAGLTSRLQWLPCGAVIVSHFFVRSQLADYLPDRDPRYCLEMPGDMR